MEGVNQTGTFLFAGSSLNGAGGPGNEQTAPASPVQTSQTDGTDGAGDAGEAQTIEGYFWDTMSDIIQTERKREESY